MWYRQAMPAFSRNRIPHARFPALLLAAAGWLVTGAGAALADKIAHPTAVFAGLDKITGRIINFDVAKDETVQFGSLQVTPRACNTRPPTEAPLTDGFVEVDEVQVSNDNKRIFSGWMFAASPGLNGIEHPVYDVWLTDCKGGDTVTKEVASLPKENVLDTPARLAPGVAPAQKREVRKPAVNGAPSAAQQLGAPFDTRPPVAAAQQPRRSPTQSFFPTFANPGDARDRAVERAFQRD